MLLLDQGGPPPRVSGMGGEGGGGGLGGLLGRTALSAGVLLAVVLASLVLAYQLLVPAAAGGRRRGGGLWVLLLGNKVPGWWRASRLLVRALGVRGRLCKRLLLPVRRAPIGYAAEFRALDLYR